MSSLRIRLSPIIETLAALAIVLPLSISIACGEAAYESAVVCYRPELNAEERAQCSLELYYPSDRSDQGFATVVWFHGGGLRGGQRSIPNRLKEQGIAVVAPSYRLHPTVKSPTYVQDAAAAVAWTMKSISKYGGDPQLVFVSGHSAGGYLTSMIGYDKSYLSKHEVDANHLAGLIPFSGHTITHFTVREERGQGRYQIVVDEMAPLFYVRKDAAPTLLITGDRDLEMLGRYEENAYFWRMLRAVGHPDAELHELQGYGHGMVEPALPLLLKFVEDRSKARAKAVRTEE